MYLSLDGGNMVCLFSSTFISQVFDDEFKFCSQWRHDYKLFSNLTTIKNIKKFKKNNAQLEAYNNNTTAVD